jgi:hypothetical protein
MASEATATTTTAATTTATITTIIIATATTVVVETQENPSGKTSSQKLQFSHFKLISNSQ